MHRVRIGLLLSAMVVVLMCPALARAAGEGGVTISDILSERVLGIIVKLVIPILLAYLAKEKYVARLVRLAKEALEMGVSHSYEKFVRPLKADVHEHPNGKLREGERGDAREIARNKAISLVKGGARRLLLKWGTARMNNFIEDVVSRRKNRK